MGMHEIQMKQERLRQLVMHLVLCMHLPSCVYTASQTVTIRKRTQHAQSAKSLIERPYWHPKI